MFRNNIFELFEKAYPGSRITLLEMLSSPLGTKNWEAYQVDNPDKPGRFIRLTRYWDKQGKLHVVLSDDEGPKVEPPPDARTEPPPEPRL